MLDSKRIEEYIVNTNQKKGDMLIARKRAFKTKKF